MKTIDKIKYVLKINREVSVFSGIIDIVPANMVKGAKQVNDSDEDYFDHYFVNQNCYEDLCNGDIYYPLDDECREYIEVFFND